MANCALQVSGVLKTPEASPYVGAVPWLGAWLQQQPI